MQNDPKRAEVDDRENYYPRLALIGALIGIIVIVWLVNSSRDGSEPAAATATPAATATRDGNPAVWNRIETGTNCDALLAEKAQATDNAAWQTNERLRQLSLAYADAAWERMRELDCYAGS